MTPLQHLAQAYHRHHFSCAHCIAAGMRYGERCPIGLRLWRAYQSAL